jgi:HD-GYP domain-containing protein (c-di-GMP phosphodiesterase class II)
MSYVSVRTSTLRPDTELQFDVYVFFRDCYLKYWSANQSIDSGLLEKFKAKKVKKVFIPEAQEAKYLSYLDAALGQLQKADLSVTAKGEFAQDTLKQESENIGKTLETEEGYRSSESRIHKVVDFMLSEPKALAGMLASAGLSIDDSAHGSTASSLALAVATYSKQLSKEELTDLAVAGLLHDTALKALGFDVKDDLQSLPKERRNDFRRHPSAAIEQVAGKKFITARVLRIIEDHEEFGDGLGFPQKKRFAKLAIDSQIFNLCDAFDHFSILAGKPAAQCIDAFIEARAEHFDLRLIEILEKQIKA